MSRGSTAPVSSPWPCYQGIPNRIVRFRKGVCSIAPKINSIYLLLKKWIVLPAGAGAVLVAIIWTPAVFKDISYLSCVELAAIVGAGCMSTYTFQHSTAQINSHLLGSRKGSMEFYSLTLARLLEQFFAGLNVALFAAAIVTLHRPFVHLFLITAIYYGFSVNNYVQSLVVINLAKTERYAFRRVLDLQSWLHSENCPATVGYTVVMLLLAYIAAVTSAEMASPAKVAAVTSADVASVVKSTSNLIPEIWKSDKVLFQIVAAFAAGVAGYHLALSTVGYLIQHTSRRANIVENHPEAFIRSTHLDTDVQHFVRSPWLLIVATLAIVGAGIVAYCYGSYSSH